RGRLRGVLHLRPAPRSGRPRGRGQRGRIVPRDRAGRASTRHDRRNSLMTAMADPHPARSFAPEALRTAILRKCRESMATKEQFFTEHADRITECAAAMARSFDAGGRLFVMGNGGSSCDAAHVSVEFMHPIIEKRPALPAIALTTDTAILTAVGNDQGFAMAFTEQLRMLGRPGDLALGISTSRQSANVN